MMRRVAVVGSGIAGLAVAHGLAYRFRPTLFEAANYFGGHTHTVDLTLGGLSHGIDCGFLVMNERTYPNLVSLLRQLEVAIAPSDMSFSVQVPESGLEWSGSSLDAVFAQRRNLLRPEFWRMLADVRRFNRIATDLVEQGLDAGLNQPLGKFLLERRFSKAFRDWYFLPMISCIWSCPTQQMLRFPIGSMIRFCHNHGLIQVTDRPQWHTVVGGARRYVDRMLAGIPDARLACPVRQIRREGAGRREVDSVLISTDAGTERFDAVVLACHSDQALALLADPTPTETATLGAIRYHTNRAVLHTDISVLPKVRRAWAAWNYERAADGSKEQAAVCVHYLINRLQPLPFTESVLVSLNPLREPRAESVHGVFEYAHPVFDSAAIAAQRHVASLQGQGNTWFCGAWTRYGFHEDGLMSGQAVCADLARHWDAIAAAPDMEPA